MHTPRESTDELACTLTEEELKARRQFVREAIKPFIRSVETKRLCVTIAFRAGIKLARVEELVALERQCCGFLTFTVIERGDRINLEITGPDGSEEVLKMFSDAPD